MKQSIWIEPTSPKKYKTNENAEYDTNIILQITKNICWKTKEIFHNVLESCQQNFCHMQQKLIHG